MGKHEATSRAVLAKHTAGFAASQQAGSQFVSRPTML